MTAIVVAMIVCAGVVIVRALCLLARASRDGWPRWRHLAFTAAAAGLATGAFGVIAAAAWGGTVLLASLAGLIVFDRRRRRTGG